MILFVKELIVFRLSFPCPWFCSNSPFEHYICDNIANPQSWNLYGYVNGNPVNFNDPGGHYISISSIKSMLAKLFGVAVDDVGISTSNDTTQAGGEGETSGNDVTDSGVSGEKSLTSVSGTTEQTICDPNNIIVNMTPDPTTEEPVLTLGNCGNELDINQNGIIENFEITNVVDYRGNWEELPEEQQATVVFANKTGESETAQVGIIYRLVAIYAIFTTNRMGCEERFYKAVEPEMLGKLTVWMPSKENPSQANPYRIFPWLGGETYNRPLAYGSLFIGPYQWP